MKNFAVIRQFSARMLIAASLCPLLAACSSMSVDDLALGNQPTATVAPQPANQAPAQQPVGFPNLNLAVTPAATQISQEERQLLVDQLTAKRPASQDPTAVSLTKADHLKLLAEQREAEVLSTIESTR